jgi:hypothetical protein
MSQTVTTTINYGLLPEDGSKPYTNLGKYDPSTGRLETNARYHAVEVQVEDLRGKEDSVSLDTVGFQFGVHESKVKGFYDQKEIEEVYYPESIELIKKVTGASKVVIFDHSVSPSHALHQRD